MSTSSFGQDLDCRRLTVVVAAVATLSLLGACASKGSTTMGFGGTSATPSAGAGSGAGAGGNSGGGSGGGGDVVGRGGTNPGGNTRASSVLGATMREAGNTVDQTGQLTSGLPKDGPARGVVGSTGEAVSELGKGVANGLGQLGQTADPVGKTLDSAKPTVRHMGAAVSSLGGTVSAAGKDTPLAAVTQSVGGLVDGVGANVGRVGEPLGTVLGSSAIRQVTGRSSEAIVAIDGKLETLTQQTGRTTGLGPPVDGLTDRLGQAIVKGGGTLPGSRTNGVSHALGTTVANVGDLVNAQGGGTGGGLGGLTGGLGGLTGGLGGLGVGLGLGLGAGVGVGVGGVTDTSAGGSGLVAPVVNTVTGLAAPVLSIAAPVTGATGTGSTAITGGLLNGGATGGLLTKVVVGGTLSNLSGTGTTSTGILGLGGLTNSLTQR